MNRKSSAIALLLIIIVHAICNYLWLKNDEVPLWYDFGGYFDRSIDLYKAAGNPSLFAQAVLGIGAYAKTYHPQRIVLPLSSLPLYFLFGISEDIAVMSLTIFFAILVFSIYGITKEIAGNKAGILSAFIILTTPGIFWLSRHYSPEFVCTAITALTIYILIKTDNFRNRKYSVILGFCLGLGMLTKEIYFVFVVGPFLYAVFHIFTNKQEKTSQILNAIISLGIGGMLTSIWYLPHLHNILSRLKNIPFSNWISQTYNLPEVFSMQGVLFYAISSINWGTYFFYFLLFISMLFIFYKNKNQDSSGSLREIKWLIAIWIMGSYLILTLIPSKCEEYFNPFYPTIAIIIGGGAFLLKKILLRRIITTLIIIIGSLQFFCLSFRCIHQLPEDISVNIGGTNIIIFRQNDFFLCKRGDWKIKEILRYIDTCQKQRHNPNIDYSIYVTTDIFHLNVMVVKYYANLMNLPCQIKGTGLRFNNELLQQILHSADFIITKTGYQGILTTERERDSIIEKIEKSDLFVRLPKEIDLPDGNVVTIYRRSGQKI